MCVHVAQHPSLATPLDRYSPEVARELEVRAEEEDFINGIDRAAMKKGKEFVFFQVCCWNGQLDLLSGQPGSLVGWLGSLVG